MTLERGALARVDKRILAALDHEAEPRLVKVPVSEAAWSVWRRYCEALGISMGEGIAALLAHELGTVIDPEADERLVLASELQRRLLARAEELDAQERRLAERERSVREAERRLRFRTMPLSQDRLLDAGRNDPCPCGSGSKYKRCHGFLGDHGGRRARKD